MGGIFQWSRDDEVIPEKVIPVRIDNALIHSDLFGSRDVGDT
jgi:hypothetical protein